MPAATVFVSYSQRDREALDCFKRFVRPLEREGLMATGTTHGSSLAATGKRLDDAYSLSTITRQGVL